MNPSEASIIPKQIPIAKWQLVDVVFGTANSDVVVGHKLAPFQPNDVKFYVTDNPTGGVVYRGSKAAQKDYIVLRSTVTGTYHILLFLEARAKA